MPLQTKVYPTRFFKEAKEYDILVILFTISILLDTGCTTSIINDKIVKNLSWSKGPKVSWKTLNGYFNTTNTVKVQFTLFELYGKIEKFPLKFIQLPKIWIMTS